MSQPFRIAVATAAEFWVDYKDYMDDVWSLPTAVAD